MLSASQQFCRWLIQWVKVFVCVQSESIFENLLWLSSSESIICRRAVRVSYFHWFKIQAYYQPNNFAQTVTLLSSFEWQVPPWIYVKFLAVLELEQDENDWNSRNSITSLQLDARFNISLTPCEGTFKLNKAIDTSMESSGRRTQSHAIDFNSNKISCANVKQ